MSHRNKIVLRAKGEFLSLSPLRVRRRFFTLNVCLKVIQKYTVTTIYGQTFTNNILKVFVCLSPLHTRQSSYGFYPAVLLLR